MCGIGGVFGWTDDETLDEMLDSIIHRGPDQEGRHIDPQSGVMMGARRLSIVGLESGSQPIYNESESVSVVFNGEIYNYPSLRSKLERNGHTFATDCDTEVLVHLWEEYGTDMPRYLNGMFAFSLWDENDETLFLARDRLGIKPLYYAATDGGLVWGSEISTVLAAGIDRTLSEEGVYRYFSLRYSPWPGTLFENICKLPPATSLEVSENKQTKRQYWSLPNTETTASRSSIVSQIRDHLKESVQRRLMADVPIGAFLSGGLDSSIIVGLLSEFTDTPVRTYSIGFDQPAYDESSEAEFVADHFGTKHTELTVDLSQRDLFANLVATYGEPLADPAVLPTMLLAERASDDLRVILTGEGADELFAGYRHQQMLPRHRSRFGKFPQFVYSWLSVVGDVTPTGQKYFEYASSLDSDKEVILDWILGYGTAAGEFIDTDLDPRRSGLQQMVDESVDEETRGTLARLSRYLITHELPDDLLYKVDHATMSSSLEARVPFLDHEFVSFAHSIPSKYKLESGYKPLLNEAFTDLVPQRVRRREKHGFNLPVAKWFRDDYAAINQWLTEEHLSKAPYIDSDEVFKYWDAHRRNKADHRDILWRSLNYVAWYQTFVVE